MKVLTNDSKKFFELKDKLEDKCVVSFNPFNKENNGINIATLSGVNNVYKDTQISEVTLENGDVYNIHNDSIMLIYDKTIDGYKLHFSTFDDIISFGTDDVYVPVFNGDELWNLSQCVSEDNENELNSENNIDITQSFNSIYAKENVDFINRICEITNKPFQISTEQKHLFYNPSSCNQNQVDDYLKNNENQIGKQIQNIFNSKILDIKLVKIKNIEIGEPMFEHIGSVLKFHNFFLSSESSSLDNIHSIMLSDRNII